MRQNVSNDNFSEAVCIIPPIANQYDATANDSDKTFTVPDNEMWKITHCHMIFVSSATAGNRQIQMSINDADGNPLQDISAGAVQAASTTRHYGFLQGIYRETSFIDSEIQVPIPIDCYIPSGGSIRFMDNAAIAPTTDDMTVSFQYMKYNV